MIGKIPEDQSPNVEAKKYQVELSGAQMMVRFKANQTVALESPYDNNLEESKLANQSLS
jgi:hypothetical protein